MAIWVHGIRWEKPCMQEFFMNQGTEVYAPLLLLAQWSLRVMILLKLLRLVGFLIIIQSALVLTCLFFKRS